MPLAIELAATWVRMLSCQEIVDELQRSIDFLVLADRDMPPRHHSMRAVLDHSWALLNGEEQRLHRLADLRRVAVGVEERAGVGEFRLHGLA